MTSSRRWLPAFLLVALVSGACGSVPGPSADPSGTHGASGPSPTPRSTERPFAPTAWPAHGSACTIAGYEGRLGRVEAVGPLSVRFTLCAPDGAFPARLAHPSLGVVDAAAVDAVAKDPAAARTVAGAGGFRITAWTDDGNLRLARIGEPVAGAEAGPSASSAPAASPGSPGASASGSAAPASSPPPVIVLRWATSPEERTAALRAATVDGIDAPAPADAADMATLPELVVLPRPGLETAYLGFGTGKSLSQTGVRRAFAQALDLAAIARDAFPPGSAPATHTTPCEVPSGCAGTPWYEFNGPAASAALDAANFDRKVPLILHVPDAPLPGLPSPAATAAAVRDQLKASVGVTVEIDVMSASELTTGVAEGTLDGLYLGGVRSSLADPSGFLEPLFGERATGTAAERAKGVREALAEAAQGTAGSTRALAFAAANDAIRSTAAIVPMVHAGSTVAYRADVTGIAVSPLGVDPVGTFVPGDRRQLVVMGEREPAGSWCAVDASPEALRLCALVTPGLYAFDGATLETRPALASRCTPSPSARTWTCRLRENLVFSDGARVDAADVVESIRAEADAGSALRAAFPATAFAAWDELFGGPVPATAR
jgi:peptide/nickel transport system substrate-binding protein